MMQQSAEIPNNISQIARLIRKDWKNIYFGAIPYLEAMEFIDDIRQSYYEDSAKNIVLYFMGNAGAWRGETARQVKAKLKELLKNA